MLNRRDGKPFDARDERLFGELMESVSVMPESSWKIAEERRHA